MKKNTVLGRKVIGNFLYNCKALIYFEMAYKIIVWFIFLPLNYYILNVFLNQRGVNTITNKQITKFALSYDGLFYMALMLCISFIAVFVEIITLIYICKKSYHREKANILEGMASLLKAFKSLGSIYSIGVITISTIIGPLAGVGLFKILIESFSIPDYLKYQLSKQEYGMFTFIVGAIILTIILFRWILAFPAMVIEKGNLKTAFKHGEAIYKKNKLKIVLYIVVWVLINYGVKIFLLGGFVGSGIFLINLTDGNTLIQQIISNFSLIIFFIGYVIISIVSLPMFISFLVELYYKYRFYQVKENMFVLQMKKGKSEKRYSKIIELYKRRMFIVVTILFISVVGGNGIKVIFSEVVDKNVEITAHRGSPLKAPENSASAVVEAILEDADYIEIDVMTTLDDHVVLFHDNTIRRFTGSNEAIRKLTLEQVQQIDIGSSFGGSYKGETIPTLEEILNLSKDEIKLNIELKVRKKDDKLAELVANMVTEYGLEDQVVISSQSYDCLQRVKAINPLIDVGLIVTFGIGDFSKMDVDFISIDYRMLDKELVYTMHALDREVHVWTINDVKTAEYAIKIGVDNIITDNVELVQKTEDWIHENHHVDYVTRFLDGVTSLIKYVKM